MVERNSIAKPVSHSERLLLSMKARMKAAVSLAGENGTKVIIAVQTDLPGTSSLTALISSELLRVGSGFFALFWRSHQQERWVAIDEADRLQAEGDGRLTEIQFQVNRYGYVDESARTLARWFGGAAFTAEDTGQLWRNYPGALFVLPRLWIEETKGHTRITLQAAVESTSDVDLEMDRIERAIVRWMNMETELRDANTGDGPYQVPLVVEHVPSRSSWLTAVAASAAEIRTGDYDKVVLARRETVRFQREVDLPVVVRRLANRFPESTVFAVRMGNESFVGASPEQLVQVRDANVRVDALAGTTRRGQTTHEDEQLARELLGNAKERLEHAAVLDWIRDQLDGLTGPLNYPPTPRLRKLQNVQHLHTPIQAATRPGTGILDLVIRLHPTPAVAGVPRSEAIAVLKQRETMNRGWYAGPLGWFDGAGNGDFIVALRCAFIDQSTAHLYAGAGIMGDSDPEQEWVETHMKLKAIRFALMGYEEEETE